MTPPTADAALNVSSLSIDGGAGSESLLSLGNFVLSSTPAGDFEVRAPDGRAALSVDAAGAVSVHGQLHARGSLRVDGKLNYLGLSQWFLARAESFEASCSAWSNCTRTSCGAIRMLGGYGAFAGGEVPPSPAQFRRNPAQFSDAAHQPPLPGVKALRAPRHAAHRIAAEGNLPLH